MCSSICSLISLKRLHWESSFAFGEVPVAFLVFQQIVVMLLLMLVGLVLAKLGYLSAAVTKKLGAILLTLVIPDVVLRSLAEPGVEGDMAGLALSFALAAAALAISCGLSFALWGRRRPIDDFAASYANPSFFAIPLVEVVYGDGAVFYMAGFIALLNILQWTFGSWVLTGDVGRVKPKAIFLSPVFLATVAGVAIYALQLSLPPVITGVMDMIAQLNTPLAMLVLGSYLAKLTPRSLLLDAKAYLPCLVRLVLAPLATLALMVALRIPEGPLATAVLLAACAPVGAGVALYAQQYDMDAPYAVKLISLSTVLSAVSIPLIYQLSTLVL